jgi:prevent-host-death family protein
MPTIGVRDLKNRTSAVIRDVREHGAEYTVTLDGKPVAVISPVAATDSEEIERAWQEFFDELDAQTERIAKLPPPSISAAQAVAEQRR